MAQLRTLLDRVIDEYPTVPEVMALRALVDSTKEFCSRTHIWRETLVDPIQTTTVGTKFVLTPGPGRVVAAALEVRVDGRELEPVPTGDRRMYRPGAATPRCYSQWSPAMIEMDATPLPGAIIQVKAALSLATDAPDDTDVPEDVLNEYGEALAAGAKMRLVRMFGQSWSNPEMGVMYGGAYYNAIATAKRRTSNALDQAEQRVEMRPFA